MTATAPAGYTLVVCSGSSTPNSSGSTATQPVTVPSGGTGVGIFYVTPVTQTLSGHIYLCGNSNPTTTEVSGGTLAASGPTTVSATPNPLAPTQVGAGMYTVTATAPAGYTLVVCSGSSTPNSSGSTATQPVTVPSGGTGVGIFYVVASPPVAPSPTTAASTNPAAASPPSSPSTATPPTSASETPTSLAFTGAAISFEWLLALVMVLLGSLLVVLGRRRRGEGWLEVAQSLQRDEFADCSTGGLEGIGNSGLVADLDEREQPKNTPRSVGPRRTGCSSPSCSRWFPRPCFGSPRSSVTASAPDVVKAAVASPLVTYASASATLTRRGQVARPHSGLRSATVRGPRVVRASPCA